MAEIHHVSDGARLFALDQGTGEPVVYLHGGLADHRSALHQAGALAASHRLITPDLRGAGRSHHHGPLGWTQYADDIASLLDTLGIERATIGGSSAGSSAALAFALRHPRRTRALLLVAPIHAGQEHGLTAAQRAAFARMQASGERAHREGIAAMLPLYAELPEAIRERACAMVLSFDAASVAATTRFLASEIQPFATRDEPRALTMPVRILAGTDPEHPVEVAHRLADAIVGATLGAPGEDVPGAIAHFSANARS